jgi:hypothetical protein
MVGVVGSSPIAPTKNDDTERERYDTANLHVVSTTLIVLFRGLEKVRLARTFFRLFVE